MFALPLGLEKGGLLKFFSIFKLNLCHKDDVIADKGCQ